MKNEPQTTELSEVALEEVHGAGLIRGHTQGASAKEKDTKAHKVFELISFEIS
ncbi:MAG: hypothetical protein AAGC79_04890 [Pseudomonadota bacterium]